MKFSVPRNEINKAIQRIAGVVPTKTTTPILYDLLFEVEGNQLKITATDLEVLTSTSIKIDGMRDGKIAIPAKFINDIIRELGNVQVNIDMEESYRVKLKTSQGEYRIVSDPGDEFPLMPIEEDMKTLEISTKQIKQMIDKCIFAVSQDELRPALMGVLFQIRTDEFCMVGTDGHRLSRIINKSLKLDLEEQDFIVPTKALILLDKNIEPSDERVKISYSKNYVIFDLKNIRIYSRLVDSEYPDYESVIPVNNEKKLIVDTSLLLGSIRRVAIFSSSLTHQIEFSIENNNMEVFSQDIDVGGEGKETINVDYTDEAMEIGFNAQYFIDVLKHIDTEKVVIMLDSPITAAMILPENQQSNEDFSMILMPVRLNDYYEESEEENVPYEDEQSYQKDSDEVDI